MKERISLASVSNQGRMMMYAFEEYIAKSELDNRLFELIKVRASQLNNCAHCINIHTKDAMTLGETPQRLFLLNGWRETDLFTEKERAVLALTEAVTLLSENGVPDNIYQDAADNLTEKELALVIYAIVSINGWNRVSIATGMKLDNKSMLF